MTAVERVVKAAAATASVAVVAVKAAEAAAAAASKSVMAAMKAVTAAAKVAVKAMVKTVMEGSGKRQSKCGKGHPPKKVAAPGATAAMACTTHVARTMPE